MAKEKKRKTIINNFGIDKSTQSAHNSLQSIFCLGQSSKMLLIPNIHLTEGITNQLMILIIIIKETTSTGNLFNFTAVFVYIELFHIH